MGGRRLSQIEIEVHLPEGGQLAGLAEDVREGLSCPFKELPPKYFYDERGSELFEQITELARVLPDPHRARDPARARRARSSRRPIADDADRARLRRGVEDALAARRDRRDRARSKTYVPVDISEEITRRIAEELVAEYDGLHVHGIVCDYETHLERVPREEGALIAFLGGTIGNFRPGPRRSFLARIATLMYPEDRFLLGTDLVKDVAVLEAAYNDSAGVTAEFNKNVLHVLNRELDANFVPDNFEHVAFFDTENEWIDIRLRSLDRAVHRPARARHAHPLRPQRGDAHRDLDQVHARAPRGELRRRRPRAGRVVDRPGRALRAQPRAADRLIDD